MNNKTKENIMNNMSLAMNNAINKIINNYKLKTQ